MFQLSFILGHFLVKCKTNIHYLDCIEKLLFLLLVKNIYNMSSL